MDAAAADSGRSVAQEIELRLENSFGQQDAVLAALKLAYGSELAGLLVLVGDAMRAVSHATPFFIQVGEGEVHAPWRYGQMMAAAQRVLAQFAPAGVNMQPRPVHLSAGPDVPAKALADYTALALRHVEAELNLGRTMAERRIAQVADDSKPDIARELLGPELAPRATRPLAE